MMFPCRQRSPVGTPALVSHLWEAHPLLVAGIGHRDCDGLRVSPSVYSTPEEVDRFCEAMESVLTRGLPS